MEESKENKEPTSVEIEQVFQNYLIDPDYFTSNFEKAVTTLSEVKLPLEQLKLESDKSNNFISENISTKKFDKDDDDLKFNKNIPFFNAASTTKLETPAIVLEKPNIIENVSKKDLNNVITQLSATVNPAIKNLYTSVSALMNKGKDPKGFTEVRPTYNGDLFFFSDEIKKVSKKFIWS